MNTDFKIRFDSESHEIDAQVLVNSVMHTCSIIQELNKELESDKHIQINIKALEKGSFLIHLDLVETALESLKNLFTKENIFVADSLIAIFVGVIQFCKFSKGKKVKSKKLKGNQYYIENVEGDFIYIDKFVVDSFEKNSNIEKAINNTFKTIEAQDSIEGIEITDSEEKVLTRVDRKEFEFLSKKTEEVKEDKNSMSQRVNLNIARVSFDDSLNWAVYLKGHRISVKMNDPEFQKRIDTGESFAKGDVLEVELETIQVFDASINTYINKSYKVNKIYNHIKRQEPPKLL